MIGILIYISALLLLYQKYKRNWTVSRWIVLLYLLSSVTSFIKYFYRPFEYPIDNISNVYYAMCVLVLLVPFLKYGAIPYNSFSFSPRVLKILSLVLIFFGLINLVYNIPRLFSVYTLINNMAEIRQSYYRGENEVYSANFLELMSNYVGYIQFLSPFLAFYFLGQQKKLFAVLLVVASVSKPLSEMIIGEREASLLFVSNYIFSFLYYAPILNKAILSKIKRAALIVTAPFIAFLALMTIARFGDSEEGVWGSLCDYAGAQPFSFSYASSAINIDAQTLGGRLSFPFLFSQNQQLEGVLNDHIRSNMDLNTFMGFPGSILLDYGHAALLVILLMSFIFHQLIRFREKGSKYLFHNFFAILVLYQILFMGLFYFEPISKYHITMYVLVYSLSLFYEYYTRNKKSYHKTI